MIFKRSKLFVLILVGLLILPISVGAATVTEKVISNTNNVITIGGNVWIAPPGVTTVDVEAWGAGGAGGPATGDDRVSSGGGGGGGYSRNSAVSVTPGSSYAITVAGYANSSTTALRVDGLSTTFDSTTVVANGGTGAEPCTTGTNCTTTGGAGATAGTGSTAAFGGGNGGNGTAGSTSGGGGGGAGSTGAGNNASGGTPGAAKSVGGGAGGQGTNSNAQFNNGNNFGGGGSGARLTSGTGDRAGGDGAGGALAFTYDLTGYPVIIDTTTGRVAGSDSTSHPITMPSSITVGDLILIVFSYDRSSGSATASIDSGNWTKLGERNQSNDVASAIFYKFAEGSDTATVTTSALESSSHVVYQIRNAGTPEAASVASGGVTANTDPPSLTPTGGALNYLWLVTRSGDSSTSVNGWAGGLVATAPPTDFSSLQTVSGDSSGGATTNVARRFYNASSYDPGGFTSSGEQAVSFTIAIPPGDEDPITTLGDGTDGGNSTIGPLETFEKPAFVQRKVASNPTGATNTSQSVTMDNPVTVGNKVLVAVAWGSSSGLPTSVEDDLGNVYTTVTPGTATSNSQYMRLYESEITEAGTPTITATWGTARAFSFVIAEEFSGLANETAHKQAEQAQGSPGTGTDAVSSGNITTTLDGALIWGVTETTSNFNSVISAGTGFTASASANTNFGKSEYMLQSAAGTTAATFTYSVANGALTAVGAWAPVTSLEIDRFTLSTTEGDDTVTGLTVTLAGNASAYTNVETVAVKDATGMTTYCSSSSWGSDNIVDLTSCDIPVDTNEAEYTVWVTPKSHADMPAVPGASYATTATVTSITATNDTTGTDTDSATITIDNASPAEATSTDGLAGVGKNTLSWVSSAGETTNAVVLRWPAGSAGAEVPVEGKIGDTAYEIGDVIDDSVGAAATVACVFESLSAAEEVEAIDGVSGSAECTTAALTTGQDYTYVVFHQDSRGNFDEGASIGTLTPIDNPTERVRYVNTASSSGGDGTTNETSGATRAYASLAEAEAAEDGDLVAANETLTIYVSGGADTAHVNFSGWTTDKLHPVTILPFDSSQKAGTSWSTSKYRLSVTSDVDNPGALRIGNTTRFDLVINGIQIEQNQDANADGVRASAINLTGSGDLSVKILNNLLRHTDTNQDECQNAGIALCEGGGGVYEIYAVNNIIEDFAFGMNLISSGSDDGGKYVIYNNTLYNNSSAGIHYERFSTSVTHIYKNNLLAANGDDWSNGGGALGTITTSTNATSDNTSPNAAYRNSTFTFVSAGTDHAITSADTGAKDKGANLSSDSTYDFSTDITGENRVAPWDIGAFESTTATPTTIYLRSYETSGAAVAGDFTVDKPEDTEEGDVMLGFFVTGDADGTPPSITTLDGWTRITENTQTVLGGTVSLYYGYYYKVAGASEPASYTWDATGTAASSGGVILTYANVNTSSPVQTSGANDFTGTTTPTATGVTTTQDDEMIVTAFIGTGAGAGVTWTPPTGMTEVVEAYFGVSQVLQDSAGASGDKQATASVSGDGGWFIVALNPRSTTTQQAYRFFEDSTSVTPGTALATQDTAATLTTTGEAFRMRLLLRADRGDMVEDGKTMKLQYALQSGTCDANFVGETYADITTSTPISYYDTTGISDGSALGAQADMTDSGRTIVNQTYEEANNFTNSEAAVPSGQDGKWDFSLYDNGAASAGVYCIRVVDSTGALLDTYTQIPQITMATANPSVSLLHYRFRKNDGGEESASYLLSEDNDISSDFYIYDRVRLRILLSNAGSATATDYTYRLEISSGACSSWEAVPTSASGAEWYVSSITSLSNGDATTDSSGLTNPGGKSFVAGNVMTTANITPAISLTGSQFTELEFSLRSTGDAEVGTTYCFRLTNNGSTEFLVFSTQPEIVLSFRPSRGGSNSSSAVGGASSGGGDPTGGGNDQGGGASGVGGSGSGGGDPTGGGESQGGGTSEETP